MCCVCVCCFLESFGGNYSCEAAKLESRIKDKDEKMGIIWDLKRFLCRLKVRIRWFPTVGNIRVAQTQKNLRATSLPLYPAVTPGMLSQLNFMFWLFSSDKSFSRPGLEILHTRQRWGSDWCYLKYLVSLLNAFVSSVSAMCVTNFCIWVDWANCMTFLAWLKLSFSTPLSVLF